ncbi:carbohydrate kinase family protein [Oceanobacillus damuensis]|uniref:carbohydrate kinase family protein n=1 Tax=Oceanobacillus damuensis TaxID=937928 RepID=UPI000AEF177C|nr:carbohydrate kinase family protein [Oceanobacillus damuensis]
MRKITYDTSYNSDLIVGSLSSESKTESITDMETSNSSNVKATKKSSTANTNQKLPVICIGGANIDRKLYVKQEISTGTSNPVTSSKTIGGVARNIAENLGRLGEDVTLISVGGDDIEWKEIDLVSSPFMNLEHVAQLEHAATGSYTAVLDQHGDMKIALADMDIFDEITPELLKGNSDILKQAKCIIIDLNCPRETVDFLSHFTMEYNIPFVVIPVSSPKMDRLPSSLESVSWLIVNKDETEAFLDVTIKNMEDWKRAVKSWLELGVKNVIVTNGAEGVILGNENGNFRHYPAVDTPVVVDVTGAGDSFCAAVIHSWIQKKDIDYIIHSGLVNSHKTITSKHTVRQELSAKQIKIDMEEILNEKIS